MSTPLRSILAATDLGPGSDAIVRSAATLARSSGADLHLLHSLELPITPDEELGVGGGFFSRIERAEEALRGQVARTMPEGVQPASQEVIIYLARKAILERAKAVSADLIVVGPHRGGAASAHFLGSTADRVIRSSEVPCLVVKNALPERIVRIGVPVDCSDPSQGALETAFVWALQETASGTVAGGGAPEIVVMHVGWTVDVADEPDLEWRAIRPELEHLVERAVSAIPGAEGLPHRMEVQWANNPTEATLTWADREKIDLLVMGTHGRSGLERAMIGSMASGVARQSLCPVLLVPPSQWSGTRPAPG